MGSHRFREGGLSCAYNLTLLFPSLLTQFVCHTKHILCRKNISCTNNNCNFLNSMVRCFFFTKHNFSNLNCMTQTNKSCSTPSLVTVLLFLILFQDNSLKLSFTQKYVSVATVGCCNFIYFCGKKQIRHTYCSKRFYLNKCLE